jgi:hypothetical protein
MSRFRRQSLASSVLGFVARCHLLFDPSECIKSVYSLTLLAAPSIPSSAPSLVAAPSSTAGLHGTSVAAPALLHLTSVAAPSLIHHGWKLRLHLAHAACPPPWTYHTRFASPARRRTNPSAPAMVCVSKCEIWCMDRAPPRCIYSHVVFPCPLLADTLRPLESSSNPWKEVPFLELRPSMVLTLASTSWFWGTID